MCDVVILCAESWPVVALLLPTLASTTRLRYVARLDPQCDSQPPPLAII